MIHFRFRNGDTAHFSVFEYLANNTTYYYATYTSVKDSVVSEKYEKLLVSDWLKLIQLELNRKDIKVFSISGDLFYEHFKLTLTLIQ